MHYAASAGDVGRLMRLFHRTIEAVARAQESDGNAFEVVEEVVGWARWLRVRSEVEGLANLMPRVRITELLHEVNCVTGIASAFTNLTTGERFDDANALLAATPQGRPLFGIAAETPEEHCQGSGYVPGPPNLICRCSAPTGLDRSTNRAPISGRTIVPLTEQLVRTQGLPAAKTTRIEDETPTKRVLVEAHTSRRTVQIKCCGQWISCDQFTTLCDNCGAGYDHAGQRLKPRYQWSDAR